MADNDKLWFELGIRDNISKELNKILKLTESIADNLSFKNVNAFAKIISDSKEARKSIKEALSGISNVKDIDALKQANNDLVKFERELRHIIMTEDLTSKAGKAAFGEVVLKIQTATAAVKRYTSQIDTMKSKMGELTEMKTQLESAINRASVAGIDTNEAKRLLRDIAFKRGLAARAANNPGMTPTSLLGDNWDTFIGKYKTVLKAIGQDTVDAEKAATQATREYADANKNLMSSYNDVASAANKSSKFVQQMAHQWASMVSLYGAERLLKNIVTIGGQFEVQHVALQNILGDAQEANILFERLKGLAIESPNTFMQLTTYAKQLSAYQIPAKELYDTTKRLADISAGLGVDMNRLILAFGQVRSASVLRGQELRQFTEAGIPLVQKLAEKFTEMNGKLTTTADVFKLISARAVPFEMVRDILWDMTDQGGQFYNMQEALANTLYGKWQKLQDAWQIMLGNIADGNTLAGSFFKVVIEGLVTVTQHLDKIVPLLTAVTFAKISRGLFGGMAKMWNDLAGNTAITNMQIAKVREANRLERERLLYGKQLTAEEARLVMERGKLTSQDYFILAIEGQLTKKKEQQLIMDGHINAEHAQRIALLRQEQALQNASVGGGGKAMGMLFGVGKTGILGMMGGVVGIAMTAVGLISTIWSFIDQSDEELNGIIDSIASRSQQNANQLEGVLKNVQSSSDETFKKVEALEEALIGMGDAGKQAVQESRNFEDIDKRFESLTKSAEAYQKVLEKISTDEGKVLIKKAYDDSDLKNEVEELEGLQESETNRMAALQRYSAKYTQMIEAMKTKHKELEDQLNKSSLYENLRILLSGDYEAEAVNYFAGGARSALAEYAQAVDRTEVHLENIKNRVIPQAMSTLRTLAIQSGVDVNKKYEELTDQEKMRLRAISQNFADGLEKGSEDARSSIAQWVAQGFYAQLHLIPIIDFNDKSGVAYAISEWQKRNGYATLWNDSDMKSVASDPLGFSSRNTQRKLDLEKKVKQLNEQLSDKNMLPEVRAAFTGQLTSVTTELEGLNKSLEDGLWVFDRTLAKGSKGGSGSKKDTELERIRNRVELYKKFYQELQGYTKLHGEQGALAKLRKDGEFGTVFDWKLSDVKDYERSIRQLTATLEGNTEERRKFLNMSKADTQAKARAKETEDLKEYVSELQKMLNIMSEKYGVYKEWLDLTGDSELAARVAGVAQNTNYADYLRGQMKKELDKTNIALTPADIFGMKESDVRKLGEDNGIFKVWEDWQRNQQKITKENQDLLKEAIKNARSLDSELDSIARKYQKSRDAISGDKNLSQSQKDSLLANLQKNEDQEKANARWEWFKKNTEGWGEMFSDMDRMTTSAISSMIENLERMLPSITADEKAVKELYNALDKLREASAKRNPFGALFGSVQRSSRLSSLLRAMGRDGSVTPNKLTAQYYGLQEGKTYSSEEIKKLLNGAAGDFTKALEGLSAGFKAVQDVLQPVVNLFDQLGNEGLSNFFAMGSNALGSAVSVAGGLKTLGLGSLGPYGAAAAAGLSIVSSLIAQHDESLQKEIEASQARQKEMENLTKNLEAALGRAISGIYGLKASESMLGSLDKAGRRTIGMLLGEKEFDYRSADTKKAVDDAKKSKTYYDATYASLLLQRDELKHQMAMEEDKKDSDADKLADYRQQLTEMEADIRDFAKDMAEALYDIDFKSWAQDLSETLVSAWASGEDAAEAYKSKVSEILKNLGVKMIAERFVSQALEPIMEDFLKQYEQDNGVMTTQGMEILARMYDAGESLQKQTSDFMDGINEISMQYGADIKGGESKSTSASAGIKGVTEQTADLLASYINAMRADLSTNRAMIALYYPQFASAIAQNNAIASAQLAQLQMVVQNTGRNADLVSQIYDILHRVAPDGTSIRIK